MQRTDTPHRPHPDVPNALLAPRPADGRRERATKAIALSVATWVPLGLIGWFYWHDPVGLTRLVASLVERLTGQ